MSAVDVVELPREFPGWPSGDRSEIAQLRLSLEEIVERLQPHLPDQVGFQYQSGDAEDGLGPYRGFHIHDGLIGFVVFLQYPKAPIKGAAVLVDRKVPSRVAVKRLSHLLKLEESEVEWLNPEAEMQISEVADRSATSDLPIRVKIAPSISANRSTEMVIDPRWFRLEVDLRSSDWIDADNRPANEISGRVARTIRIVARPIRRLFTITVLAMIQTCLALVNALLRAIT